MPGLHRYCHSSVSVASTDFHFGGCHQRQACDPIADSFKWNLGLFSFMMSVQLSPLLYCIDI